MYKIRGIKSRCQFISEPKVKTPLISQFNVNIFSYINFQNIYGGLRPAFGYRFPR